MEKLSAFHFDMFYQKGRELVICDFLSPASYQDDDVTPDESEVRDTQVEQGVNPFSTQQFQEEIDFTIDIRSY